MKNLKNYLGNIISIIASILTLGAVKIWAPVCQKQLELYWESGDVKLMNMRCFFTEKAVIYLSVILIVLAVIALVKKTKPVILPILIGALYYVSTTKGALGLGMCKTGIGMQCEQTRYWIYAAAVLAIVAGIINFIFKDKKSNSI